MTDQIAYQEYIQRRYSAFCKTVIRCAALDKILQLKRQWERQVSLDYLMNEKFVQFAAPEPDEEYPFTVCGQTVLLCNAALAATAEIAPVVEEIMKLLPLAFYLLVFEPEGEKIKPTAITVALAFATFENVCSLIQNGADRFSFIFFRGFGTGAMHVLCGIIVGTGLAYTWQRTWLKIAGTCGLLGAAITLHGIYNLLITYGGAAQYIAYSLPVLLVAAGKLSVFRFGRKE